MQAEAQYAMLLKNTVEDLLEHSPPMSIYLRALFKVVAKRLHAVAKGIYLPTVVRYNSKMWAPSYIIILHS
jgi:hypothetical protein